MDSTWDQAVKERESSLTEDTRVKVKVGTAWVVLSTIVGTTVWLTMVMLRVQATNQNEHVKLMTGLTELNLKSANWVTYEQFESATMYLVKELHGKGTNWTYWRESQLREGMRKKLRSPKEGG